MFGNNTISLNEIIHFYYQILVVHQKTNSLMYIMICSFSEDLTKKFHIEAATSAQCKQTAKGKERGKWENNASGAPSLPHL